MTLFDDYLLLILAVVMALGAVYVRDLFSVVSLIALVHAGRIISSPQ